MSKRIPATRRKAKPAEVLFLYGRLPGDEKPDHIGMWGGGGATKRHSNVVMYGFTAQRPEIDSQSIWQGKMGKSFLQELDAAGFDITTIEFKIKVKSQDSEK